MSDPEQLQVETSDVVAVELEHRLKNAFAIAAALARADGREALAGRFSALAGSVELALGRVDACDLAALARRIVEPFVAGARQKLTIRGSAVTLRAEGVQAMSLALNELATNALKHGALSTPLGAIEATWSVEAGLLRFRWREVAVPASRPAARAGSSLGAGATLMRSLAAKGLSGADGFAIVDGAGLWTVDAPARWFVAGEPDDAGRASQAAPAEKSPSLGGARVLLVEDNPIIATDVEGMLLDAGAEAVRVAATRADALAEALASAYAVAVLDLDIAGEPAAPVAAALKQRGVPFVIITGSPEVPEDPAFSGVRKLSKPFAAVALSAAVADALDGKAE